MHTRSATKLAAASMSAFSIWAAFLGPAAKAEPRKPRRPKLARATDVRAAADRWGVDTQPARRTVAEEPPAPIARNKADIAVSVARSLIGTPYRYGGTTPRGFDCSGFTAYVWGKAGVALPHNSAAQYSSSPKVSAAQARPGDLVYSPGHIGLYVGGGKMIHSPQTGDRVKVSPIHSGTIGFARPA